MDLMQRRRELMMGMANSGMYRLFEGDIIANTASNTVEIPINGTPIEVFFELVDHEDYNPSEHNMGIIAFFWYQLFWFNVHSSELTELYTFYEGAVDYWQRGVAVSVSQNAFTVTNTRNALTIPGAKYHYTIIYKL